MAGCLNDGDGSGTKPDNSSSSTIARTGTDSRTNPTTETGSECSTARTKSGTTQTEVCSDIEITRLGIEPHTRTGTASGTTIPGEAGDDVVVKVRVGGERERTLVGCITTTDGDRRSFSKTLSPRDREYSLTFGPFSHHGVEEVEVWIRECEERLNWP